MRTEPNDQPYDMYGTTYADQSGTTAAYSANPIVFTSSKPSVLGDFPLFYEEIGGSSAPISRLIRPR